MTWDNFRIMPITSIRVRRFKIADIIYLCRWYISSEHKYKTCWYFIIQVFGTRN